MQKYLLKTTKALNIKNFSAATGIQTSHEPYLAKNLIKYNNYQFKPSSSENVLLGDLLKEFASRVLNKNLIPSLIPQSQTSTKYTGLDLLAFDKDTMTYIPKDSNIFNHSRIDIAKVNFDNESLLQRYIKPNLTNQYSPKFQNELNSLLANKNLEIKAHNTISNAFSRNKDNSYNFDKNIGKMLISNFISINSDHIKPQEVTLNLSKEQISNVKTLFIVPSNNTSIQFKDSIPYKIVSVTTGKFDDKGFQDCLCEGFTTLRKLSLLSKRNNEIGIVTDLNKWFFINYINSFSKVETLDNFQISSPYVFNMQSISLEGKKQFTYFINVLESIIENKGDKLEVAKSI